MKAAYFPMLRKFFLCAALIILTAGCGSGGSTTATRSTDSTSSTSSTSATSETSSATSINTGSIAAKLVWNTGSSSALAKTADKVLYAVPAVVTTVRIIVSAGTPAMTDIVGTFAASAGSGTVSGILPGTGRMVTAQGLDSGGIIRYQGNVTGIDIVAGAVKNVGAITMNAPVTTASPAGASGLTSSQTVTLTANPGATIYYTTNGIDPTTSSTNGLTPITGIQIFCDTNLRFFAIDTGNTWEAVKSETYTFTTGCVSFTF